MFPHAIAALGVAALTLAACNALEDHELTSMVKSGEKELHCQFFDGKRKVDPDLVVEFSDGRWIFINGSASACEVVK